MLNRAIGEFKGYYYELTDRALELTKDYYVNHVAHIRLMKCASGWLKTDRFDCHVQKQMVRDVFEILLCLKLVLNISEDKQVLIMDTPFNRFVVNSFLEKEGQQVEVNWINPLPLYVFALPLYYLSIMLVLMRNGLTFKKKKQVKIYKEATWGLMKPALRDDLLVDNIHFTKGDMVFYHRDDDEQRLRASGEVSASGYELVDIRRCRLNVRTSLGSFVRLYLLYPLGLFFELCRIKRHWHLAEYVAVFFNQSFYHFLFLSNYRAFIHLSTSDHGEVSDTVIMNYQGCKNVLYHWSDMTVALDIAHAFVAHNIYYTWGDIHYDFDKAYRYHDVITVVGCIFLKTYYDAEQKSKSHDRPRILVCDTSFNNGYYFTEQFYLDFLELMIELLKRIKNAEMAFKFKMTPEATADSFTDERLRRRFLDSVDYLNKQDRFVYYDYQMPLESLIADSDILINMGINTPATIALLLGKEAVYYDTSGNPYHPFAKYHNSVVFDDKNCLIDQVENILNGHTSVFNVIDPELLASYDPYRDAGARERLIKCIASEIAST